MLSPSLPLLIAYAQYARKKLEYKTLNLSASQEHFLLNLLKYQQNSRLGRKFDLKNIQTVDQFRERVPIQSYEYYEPYVEQIASGEKKVLSPDPAIYINLTSGTTGHQKQVPVTQRFQDSLQQSEFASLGFLVNALHRRGSKFGKLLITNTIQLQGVTSGGIDYGPVSAGRFRRARNLFEQAFSLPYSALEIKDTLSRHYVCLLFALRDRHLRGMVANFPMLILRTCNYLERFAEDLIWDIAVGSIAPWLELEPALRLKLTQRLSPMPQRAMELKALFKSEGRLTPRVAWPELSYIGTSRGGTSDFYFERFPDYFGDIPIFGGVYGTAEGTFSVYTDVNTDGGVLAIASGFFEFLPQDQWDVEHPKTLLPSEVRVGERYRILVTSYSGFYRYDIGDVVEVVAFYNLTPMIVFRYRRGGLLSSTTEKTTEFHATQVMQKLQKALNICLEGFCITLSDNQFPAAYLVNVEPVTGQAIDDPQDFLAQFEHWMATFNNQYGMVRQGQVPPPRLRILAPGSFATIRQRQVERGIPDSQLKFPHISEDRQFLEGIPVLQEIEFMPSASQLFCSA